jgi:hypothetical protein
MRRVVQSVDEALRREGLASVRVGVDVSISGAVGPRCEPIDPSCGPLSSRDWDRPDALRSSPTDCVAGRVPIAEHGVVTAGRACAHDGECVIGRWGSDCVRWDQASHIIWCEDVLLLKERPVTYCGCVAGRCDWFRPAAP